MPPLVSIVLPFRAAAETLGECLHSILGQSLENWELLAVDDNSTDDSRKIAMDFARLDNRIRLIEPTRPGLVPALNQGLEAASSSLIARMDADDVMLPERLERQVAFMEENPGTGLVSSQVEHFSPLSFKTEGYSRYVEWTNALLTHEQIALNRFVESPFAHPSVLFRRQLVSQYGPYSDGDFPEDYELWLRFLEGGTRMAKLEQVLLKWRDHPDRLSRTCTRYSQDAFQRTKARYLASWLEQNPTGGRKLTAWGAGKVARRQADHLFGCGLRIECFFEVDPKKIGNPRPGLKVESIEAIPPPGEVFILVLAGARSARSKITRFLDDRDYISGQDYLFLA